jgi:hypothetical protein
LLLSLVLVPALVAAPPAGWKTFPSASGEFQVDFPGKPEESKQAIKGLDGKGNVDQIQYVFDAGTGAYLASFQPSENLAKADAKTVSAALDSAAERLAKTFAGKILSSEEVKLDTATGKEVRVDCPKIQGLIRSRMYLTNGRFYQLMVLGTKDFVDAKEAEHFLGSFKVVK